MKIRYFFYLVNSTCSYSFSDQVYCLNIAKDLALDLRTLILYLLPQISTMELIRVHVVTLCIMNAGKGKNRFISVDMKLFGLK